MSPPEQAQLSDAADADDQAPQAPRPKRDRKLGDEWKDWDGRDDGRSAAGKRLFFALSGGLLSAAAALSLLLWYLITPRLASWHPLLPWLALGLLGLGAALVGLAYGAVAVALLFRLRLPGPFSAAGRRLLAAIEGSVFWSGARLGINRDRIGHSFVRAHNALVELSEQRYAAEQVLVLLPRCLTREQLRAARALAGEYGVSVAIADGGEVARQRIMEHQPQAVIGVACERDLVSGIRDVRGRLCVLGIPNARPHGPCKDTQIDLGALRASIEHYVPGARPDARA